MNQNDQMREAMSLLQKLQAYGYAPGNYSGTCGKCAKQMNWVDKRTVYCMPCALEKMEKAEQALAHVNETPKNEHDSDDVLKLEKLVRLTEYELVGLMYDSNALPECQPTQKELIKFAEFVQTAFLKKNGG